MPTGNAQTCWIRWSAGCTAWRIQFW
jgi:hypothetical protein